MKYYFIKDDFRFFVVRGDISYTDFDNIAGEVIHADPKNLWIGEVRGFYKPYYKLVKEYDTLEELTAAHMLDML